MSNKDPGEMAMNTLTGVLFFVSLLLGATIIRKRRRLAKKTQWLVSKVPQDHCINALLLLIMVDNTLLSKNQQ